MKIFALGILLLASGVVATSVLAADEKTITYDEHIKPIFRENCLKCHGEDTQKAGFNFSTYESVLKGGNGGQAVVAGRASVSLIFQAITAEDEGARMPPNKPPLPAAQIELIRTWIQSGLRENAGGKALINERDTSFKPLNNPTNDGPAPMPQNWPVLQPLNLKRPLAIVAMAASPVSPLLAVASYGRVKVINLNTQQPIGSLPFPEGQPDVIRFSRDGRLLLVAGGKPVQSGSVVLYDVQIGKRLTAVGDELDEVQAADLSPDQKLIALGGSGKLVKVYSTENGKLLYKISKHTDWITALAFSPDGKILASADRAGAIHLWDSESGGILLSLSEHKAAVHALAWRSDGRMLASGGEDGQLIWWDAKDGWPTILNTNAHPPARPAGFYGRIPNGVLALSFGPAGELLSAGRDNQIRLWNAEGRALKAFPVAFLPLQTAIGYDGKTLIAGDLAGALQFWPAP